jgi:glutathione S-transferase
MHMDFYYFPKSSSQAAHILLHEAAIQHVAHPVDIFTGSMEDGRPFTQVNPNGYVPALVLPDGRLLTENVALLDWIAARAGLSPVDEAGRTRQLQLLAFLSTEVHKPFVRLFFAADDSERAELQKTLAQRFGWLALQQQGEHLLGAAFSAADAFAYGMLRWAATHGIDVPAGLTALARRVEGRAAVQAVLAIENETPLFAA